jgi:hypothetical protein
MSSSIPPVLQKSLDETKVEYRRLGKSGLIVSVPILGAMSFGTKKSMDWVLEEDEVRILLQLQTPPPLLV